MAEREKQEWIGNAFIGIGLGGMAFFGALAAASATLGALAVPVWGLAIGIVAVTVRSPIAKAFADRLAGRSHEPPEEIGPEVFGELDELRARVLEMEERQDFAERLLAKSQPPEGT